MNPDIEKERRSPPFQVEKLINLIDGSAAATARKREIENVTLKEPLFTDGQDYNFLSREEQYVRALKKGKRMWEIAVEYGYANRKDYQYLFRMAFPSESAPNSLHWVMFIPSMQSQASEEQQEKWMPAIMRGELIGTYAQTEMGHGTALRNIEATATYDPKTETFDLHSPTLTSAKWWPGGLGTTCNCCVFMAQLITQGKNYGMHPFFIQYRRLDDHSPLPGVTAGDIGPKFGYDSIDNGFLRLDHFKIPRENMLMKHAKVLKDGTYVSMTSQKKPSYGVMTMTRVGIIERNATYGLAAAVTIAVRYSVIRRQSELNPSEGEPQILDYRTQQYKLFPNLAMAYAFKWSADEMFSLHEKGTSSMDRGNDQLLPEVHALSSGMKAFCTNWMGIGIEQCRLSCGGHGYSHASGIPKLYRGNIPACTFEGENTVLLLQTARYLMKIYQSLSTGNHTLPDSLSYLGTKYSGRSTLDDRLQLSDLVDCFQYRAQVVIRRAAQGISKLQGSQGQQEWQARNNMGVDLIRAAEAYCEAFIVRSFVAKIRTLNDTAISDIMTKLCQLMACFWMLKNIGEYLETSYLTSGQVSILRERESSLLAEIRPVAVPLVDAFDFHDHFLGSALGRYDGQVYPAMYEWALKSPLNKPHVQRAAAAKL